jgi:hypothetical protein
MKGMKLLQEEIKFLLTTNLQPLIPLNKTIIG